MAEYRGGEYFKRLREASKYQTQLEVANKLGVTRGYIGQLENGRRSISFSKFLRNAELLGVDPITIFKEKDSWL